MTGLPAARVRAALALLLLGLPSLVAALTARRDEVEYATHVLLVLGLVLVVSLLGGLRVGLPAAVAGALALNWFLTPPYGTLQVEDGGQLVVLSAYLVVALAVSAVVARAARSAAAAQAAAAEAATLSALAGRALAEHETLPGVLEQVRTTFGVREVELVEATADGERCVERAGGGEEPEPDEAELSVPAGPGARLVVRGQPLFGEDQRVLRGLADLAATALEGRRLAAAAADAARYEAADRARTALLAAVGHDLRTPLAAVKAAVGSLRTVPVPPEERDELLETVEDGADRLQALVDNLLDASRLQAGAVTAALRTTPLDEVVDRALLSLGRPDRVVVEVDDTLPPACTDPGLAERVVANLLQNALRHSPAGTLVTVRGSVRGDRVRCDVVDHGPGLPAGQWGAASAAFSRLGDRTPGGLGLGLAVARGFTDVLGGTLEPRETDGGGLTVRLSLPRADAP